MKQVSVLKLADCGYMTCPTFQVTNLGTICLNHTLPFLPDTPSSSLLSCFLYNGANPNTNLSHETNSNISGRIRCQAINLTLVACTDVDNACILYLIKIQESGG